MTTRIVSLALGTLALTLALPVAAPAQTPAPGTQPAAAAPCDAKALQATIDRGNGDADGMSHAGFALSVTNVSGAACELASLPKLSFLDAAKSPLPIARQVPPGMHPGPVMSPLRLAAGATAKALVRYVDGNVFENGRCQTTAFAQLTFSSGTITLPIAAQICGPQPGATYQATPFTIAP